MQDIIADVRFLSLLTSDDILRVRIRFRVRERDSNSHLAKALTLARVRSSSGSRARSARALQGYREGIKVACRSLVD